MLIFSFYSLVLGFSFDSLLVYADGKSLLSLSIVSSMYKCFLDFLLS